MRAETTTKLLVVGAFAVAAGVLFWRAHAHDAPSTIAAANDASPAAVSPVDAATALGASDGGVADATNVDAEGAKDAGEEATDAGADAAAAPSCRAAHDRNVAAIAAMAKYAACPTDTESALAPLADACESGDAGTWSILVDRFAGGTEPGISASCGLFVEARLVRADRAGHESFVVPGKTEVYDGGPAPLRANVSFVGAWGSRSIAPPIFFDWDGDGVPEVHLAGAQDEEGADDTWETTLTFRDGKIVPYAPAAGIDVTAVEDGDGDGRPDLVSRGPYARVEAASALGGEYPVASALFLYHSLADGTFSVTDAVARAHFRAKCPESTAAAAIAAVRADAGAYVEDYVRAIACARAMGANVADVTTAFAPQCATLCQEFPADCPDADAGAVRRCPAWIVASAVITPPIRLSATR